MKRSEILSENDCYDVFDFCKKNQPDEQGLTEKSTGLSRLLHKYYLPKEGGFSILRLLSVGKLNQSLHAMERLLDTIISTLIETNQLMVFAGNELFAGAQSALLTADGSTDCKA